MNAILNTAQLLPETPTSVASSDILYISERSPWGVIGFESVSRVLPTAQAVYWSPGTQKPDLSAWRGDWIIAFKADLVLSRSTLGRAQKGAINFHPSPPKYRGLGGYWWALQNGDSSFGVTVHHMDEQIDHGEIIKTNNFPISPRDTVESLKHKAALHSLLLLNETLDLIQSGKPFAPSNVKWEPHLYTAKELAIAQGNAGRALEALTVIQGGIIGLSEEKATAPLTNRTDKLALG